MIECTIKNGKGVAPWSSLFPSFFLPNLKLDFSPVILRFCPVFGSGGIRYIIYESPFETVVYGTRRHKKNGERVEIGANDRRNYA